MRVDIPFIGEVRRFAAEERAYYPAIIADAIMTLIVFSVFLLLSSNRDGSVWIGYSLWYLAMSVVGDAAISISTDKQWGLWDQVRLRPIGLVSLVAIKTIVWTLFNAVKVVVVMAIIVLAFRLPIAFSGIVIPIVFVALVGLFGFALILVALVLFSTKASSFQGLIGYVLMFLTGAIVPLSSLPQWLASVGRALPLTQGLTMCREAFAGDPFRADQWIWLCVQSICYVAIGYASFRIVMWRIDKRGARNRY